MKTRIIIPALLLFFTACNLSGQMKSIFSLIEKVNKKYDCTSNININNNSKIVVMLEGSPWCDSSDAAKQRVSDDIGRMAMAEKGLDNSLQEGYTVFTCRTKSAINIEKETRFPMHLHKD